ncbi:MAG: hypothetical protein HRU20_02685 [Pseudomonadales bacterium]|nr:hypothetical protein [Pseudomonadales bacterium]
MTKPSQRQSGSVLLISLMLLVVATLLTFSVTESSSLQLKMTENSRDYLFALQVRRRGRA